MVPVAELSELKAALAEPGAKEASPGKWPLIFVIAVMILIVTVIVLCMLAQWGKGPSVNFLKGNS
jgi:hypothetical protein